MVGDTVRVRDGVWLYGVDMSGVWLTVTNVHVYRTPGRMSVAVVARAEEIGDEFMLIPEEYTVVGTVIP